MLLCWGNQPAPAPACIERAYRAVYLHRQTGARFDWLAEPLFGHRVRTGRSAGGWSGQACSGNIEEKIEQHRAFLLGEFRKRGSQDLVSDLVTGRERSLAGRGQV